MIIPVPEPEDLGVARAVLTDVQLLTWVAAERGATHRQIAAWRGVSKATVTDCLTDCDRKIAAAKAMRA